MPSYLIVQAPYAQRTWVKEYTGSRHRQRARMDKFSQEAAGAASAVIELVEAESLDAVRELFPSMFEGEVDIVR